MNRKLIASLIPLLAYSLVLAPAAWAQPLPPSPAYAETAPSAPALPKALVSGLLYTDFRVPTGNEPSIRGQARPLQSFNVTRSFLTGTARINDAWSGSITLNAYPDTVLTSPSNPLPTIEAHNEILQVAYLQATGMVPGNTTQLGMVFTPYVVYEADA